MEKPNMEVEIKARVKSLGEVEARLPGRARLFGEIDFHDTYFCPAGVKGYTQKRFRLRRAGPRSFVTAKQKVREGKVSADIEHEFEVSDAEAFTRFALMFGFRVMIEKRKRGRRWLFEPLPGAGSERPLVVELVTIEGLGDFVEVEIMVEKKEELAAAHRRIELVLEELGIEPEAVEARAYTRLLHDLTSGSGA